MRRLLLIASAAAVLCAGCGGAQPPPFKPVADVKQLMQDVVDPSADVVWQSVKTTYTKEGVEDRKPRNDEEWANVRNHAMMLTEAGNLLMMVPRAKDGDEWMRMSRALVDVSEAALRAAESKNVDQLFMVGGPIDEACEACHKKYWPNY